MCPRKKPREKNKKRLTAVLTFLAMEGTPQYLRRTSLSLRLVRKVTYLTGAGRVRPGTLPGAPHVGASLGAPAADGALAAAGHPAADGAPAAAGPPAARGAPAAAEGARQPLIVRLLAGEAHDVIQNTFSEILAALVWDASLDAAAALGQMLTSVCETMLRFDYYLGYPYKVAKLCKRWYPDS